MSCAMKKRGFGLFVFASFLVSACERAPIPPATEPAPTAADEAAKPGEIIDAPPALEGENYRLILQRVPQMDAPSAAPERFALTLEGRGRWKVNEGFPITLTLAADPAIELSAESLDKDDAARFEEEGARFEFEARGEGRVNASLRFAMCVPESCTFHTETLGIRLASR